MRVAVIFFYMLMTIIYLSPISDLIYLAPAEDRGRTWGGINIMTHMAMIGYLCYLLEDLKYLAKAEQLFFTYLKFISIANCIYIVWCILKGSRFSMLHTDTMAWIMGIGFIAFLVHNALRKP